MLCALKPDPPSSDSKFTAPAGPITLEIAPLKGSVEFTSHCAIKDDQLATLKYQLGANNSTLMFKGVAGRTYSLSLLFLYSPTSSYGLLREHCPTSALDVVLINPNFVTLTIAC